MKDLSNENVIHIKKNGIEFLQFRKLLEFSDTINHAYSLGIDKDYRIETPHHTPLENKKFINSVNNYKKLLNSINSDYTHIVRARQNHTKRIKCVQNKKSLTEPDICSEEYENTDGLITNKPNIMLTTTNADCILCLIFDPVKKVIANVHSGWRGTLQRITVDTIEKMNKEYGSNPADIICCICPRIGKCHFEVSKDVKEMYEKEFKELSGFIEETIKDKKWHIDTVLINKELLLQAGLKEENIIDSGICSMCNSNQIHSYRVQGKNYGLSTALIEIKG